MNDAWSDYPCLEHGQSNFSDLSDPEDLHLGLEPEPPPCFY